MFVGEDLSSPEVVGASHTDASLVVEDSPTGYIFDTVAAKPSTQDPEDAAIAFGTGGLSLAHMELNPLFDARVIGTSSSVKSLAIPSGSFELELNHVGRVSDLFPSWKQFDEKMKVIFYFFSSFSLAHAFYFPLFDIILSSFL